MKILVIKRDKDEELVKPNQSLTPTEMATMYERGEPIVSGVTPVPSTDESVNPSFDLPFSDLRNVEPAEIFEHQRESQDKIKKYGKHTRLSREQQTYIDKYNKKDD